MKDTIKSPSLDTGIDITKMHGHMDIYLTDVKTGKVEEVHEDNMMTNALQEYFRNYGFMNYPNISLNNLVVLLLGGVMGFDDEIEENASIIRVPAGKRMIFNGSVGTVNNGNPTELGSYSATESGWQQDGSYVQTYDFSTSQANGTIACVCLTGQNYGKYGEGNTTSLTRLPQAIQIFDLIGNTPAFYCKGTIIKVDVSDSSIYTFALEDFEEEQGGEIVTVKKGVIRKYRFPITKINIKGSLQSPVLLSETQKNIDDELKTATIMSQSVNGNLLIWNVSNGAPVWGSGDWVQYLWTITPSGNITRQTVINTYGEDLHGLQAAYFDGDYCFFIDAYSGVLDSTTVYVWNRRTNAITSISNPGGTYSPKGGAWRTRLANAGWDIVHGSGDGRIVTSGMYQDGGNGFVVDAILGEAWPCNRNSTLKYHQTPFPNMLLAHDKISNEDSHIYRSQSYIASINNLDNPVVKTSEKTMKVIYRITFDEQ